MVVIKVKKFTATSRSETDTVRSLVCGENVLKNFVVKVLPILLKLGVNYYIII